MIRTKREVGRAPSSPPPASSASISGATSGTATGLYRFPQPHGHGALRPQPGQLGGLALGRHAHVGNSHRLGIPEQYDLLEDALKNTEMVVFWSADPEDHRGGIYSAFESTIRRFWMRSSGSRWCS